MLKKTWILQHIAFRPKKEKILLFSETWGTRKIFTWATKFLFSFFFFCIHSPELFFFSSLVSFTFFVFLFFCLYVSFLKLTICILIHIRLCGQVSDKKYFTRRFSGNKTTFFGLSVWVGSPDNNYLNISLVSLLSNGRYITILRFFFYIVDTAFVPKISDLCNPRFENSALCKNLNGNTPLLFPSDTNVQYI